MDIQSTQLSTFLVTAQCTSFSSAAEKLFISHSALIQQMNALEKTLGFTLFHRTPKGIRLTDSGTHFYQQYSQIAKQMELLVMDCIRMEQQQSVIRVGNPNDLHTFYLYSDLYRSFNQQHPALSLEYVPTTRESVLEDCISGRIDLGNYFGTDARKKDLPLMFTPVCMELGILIPPHHSLANRLSLNAEDLRDHHIYLSNISFHDTIYEQLPALQHCHLHTFDLTMDAVYKKNRQNQLLLMPMRFQKFFPSLTFVPLEPRGWFYTEMVYRPNSTPAVQKFLEFYLDYEDRQSEF